MENKKPIKTEGLFSMADRFVADFFDRLKKGAADQIIRKAETAKLPPEVIARMKKMEKDAKEFKDFLNNL
jgi:hypothetical protein